MASPITTYKTRMGNAIPIMGAGSSSEGTIIFTFGYEYQEILSCGSTDSILGSKDMCLLGGEYFSANYKALPGKVDGKVAFSSVSAKKPVLTLTPPPNGGGCLSGDF